MRRRVTARAAATLASHLLPAAPGWGPRAGARGVRRGEGSGLGAGGARPARPGAGDAWGCGAGSPRRGAHATSGLAGKPAASTGRTRPGPRAPAPGSADGPPTGGSGGQRALPPTWQQPRCNNGRSRGFPAASRAADAVAARAPVSGALQVADSRRHPAPAVSGRLGPPGTPFPLLSLSTHFLASSCKAIGTNPWLGVCLR